MIISLSIKGECQKSKRSTHGVNSNSISTTSAEAVSVTAQSPTPAAEELKHAVDEDISVKSVSKSEKDGEKNPINKENENGTSREYLDDKEDVEPNDAALNDGESGNKLGNYC